MIKAVLQEELVGFLVAFTTVVRAEPNAGLPLWNAGATETTGTNGTQAVSVPCARSEDEDGKIRNRRSKTALFALFNGAVSKGVMSRAWRKMAVDWEARYTSSAEDGHIVCLLLAGCVVKQRVNKDATNIPVLAEAP